MDTLDEVRRESWRDAYTQVKELKKANPRKPGRPKEDDPATQEIRQASEKADKIKNSSYALGKAPENLTEKQKIRVEMISKTDKRLYRAYCLKESLRLLLKLKDLGEAEVELKHWLWRASHSRIPAVYELYKKIKRHKDQMKSTFSEWYGAAFLSGEKHWSMHCRQRWAMKRQLSARH